MGSRTSNRKKSKSKASQIPAARPWKILELVNAHPLWVFFLGSLGVIASVFGFYQFYAGNEAARESKVLAIALNSELKGEFDELQNAMLVKYPAELSINTSASQRELSTLQSQYTSGYLGLISNPGYSQLATAAAYALGAAGFSRNEKKAAVLFQASANKGNIRAQALLGEAYLNGRGVQVNEAKALELFRRSSIKGDARGQANIGIMLAEGLASLPKDLVQAVKLFQLSAAQGDPLGEHQLGLSYKLGTGGLPKDARAALNLFIASAAQSYPPAQFDLGLAYLQGKGTPKDDKLATALFKLSAEQGDGKAQTWLGQMFYHGLGGLKKDERRAVQYYSKGADQGYELAEFLLGLSYEYGVGNLPKDEDKAIYFYTLSADQGNALAQVSLGQLYLTSRTANNPKRAVQLFRQATYSNDPDGQFALGEAYANGTGGLPVDPAKAHKLLVLSASQGNVQAEYKLAIRYLFGGDGIEPNPSEADLLLRKTALKQPPLRQAFIGRLYLGGYLGLRTSLAIDQEFALILIKDAASNGSSLGKALLGVVKFEGIAGTEKDISSAVKLWRESAAQGDEYGQFYLALAYHSGIGGLPKDERSAAALLTQSARDRFSKANRLLGLYHELGLGGLSANRTKAMALYRNNASGVKDGLLGAVDYFGADFFPWISPYYRTPLLISILSLVFIWALRDPLYRALDILRFGFREAKSQLLKLTGP